MRGSRTLDDDFCKLLRHLNAKHLIPEVGSGMENDLRRMHHSAFVMALWEERLRRIPINGRVFLSEIRSDAIKVIPLGLLGYEKASNLMLRSVLENSLKHLYYLYHPIEFELLIAGQGGYLSIKELLCNLSMLSPFRQTRAGEFLRGRVENQYRNLSLDVHAHPVGHMEHKKNLAQVKFELNRFTRLRDSMIEVTRTVNFMLCIAHRGRLSRFGPEAKRDVKSQLTPAMRKMLQFS